MGGRTPQSGSVTAVTLAVAALAGASCLQVPAPEVLPTAPNTPAKVMIVTATASATSTPESLTPPLAIVTDEFDPEKLPLLEWDYITSEQFLLDLMEADRQGKIRHAPETAISLKPNEVSLLYESQTGTRMFKNHGYDNIFTIPGVSKYARLEHRPWTYVGGWQSKIEDEDIVFYVASWENADRSTGYLGYVYPNSGKSVNGRSQEEIFKSSSTIDSRHAYLTGAFFASVKVCDDFFRRAYRTHAPRLCDWFVRNPSIALPRGLYGNWQTTGILSNQILDESGERRYLLAIAPVLMRVIL